jgi:hypothetical protein
MPRSHDLTLVDVVQAVSAMAVNDEETHATMIHLISSGQVRLGDDALTAMMDVQASVDPAAWVPERTGMMPPDQSSITWGEGLAALLTLGIITFLLCM